MTSLLLSFPAGLVAILFAVMVYRASALRGLAIAQMVFGSLMIVFGIACVVSVDNWSSYVGFGFWVGIWVLITGILGYVGARDDAKPNNCLIGCFMGFSITACVIAGVMFICYCVAVAEFGKTLKCKYRSYGPYGSFRTYGHDTYCYSSSKRHNAAVGAGLGSCQLIFAIVEFFVALASSVYCCNAVCCGAPTVGSATANQQVVYLQPQHMYPGGQAGVVVIQPSGAVTTVPHGYGMPGQQTMFVPQQQPVPMQPPAYWASPSGPSPPGAVPVSYAGGTVPNQANPQQAPKEQERPPPYAYMQTGNAPPSMSAPRATPSQDAPGTMDV